MQPYRGRVIAVLAGVALAGCVNPTMPPVSPPTAHSSPGFALSEFPPDARYVILRLTGAPGTAFQPRLEGTLPPSPETGRCLALLTGPHSFFKSDRGGRVTLQTSAGGPILNQRLVDPGGRENISMTETTLDAAGLAYVLLVVSDAESSSRGESDLQFVAESDQPIELSLAEAGSATCATGLEAFEGGTFEETPAYAHAESVSVSDRAERSGIAWIGVGADLGFRAAFHGPAGEIARNESGPAVVSPALNAPLPVQGGGFVGLPPGEYVLTVESLRGSQWATNFMFVDVPAEVAATMRT